MGAFLLFLLLAALSFDLGLRLGLLPRATRSRDGQVSRAGVLVPLTNRVAATTGRRRRG